MPCEWTFAIKFLCHCECDGVVHSGLYTASPLRAFESELGVQDPVGFFDPLGFTADGSSENFKRRRQIELKHGRISMLATMGYITPEITGKFPGYLSPSADLKFADIPNGLGAISKVPPLGWAQIFAYAGFCELSQDQSPGTPAAEGDFGFKVLTSSDPEEKKKKLAAELANGRLAMMAIIGMFFQDGLTGSQKGRSIKENKRFAFSFCLTQERICSKRQRALGIVSCPGHVMYVCM